MKILVYDCEIKMMIQGRNEPLIDGLQYCAGWGDHEGMGISVICVYDMGTGTMHTLRPTDSELDMDVLQNLISSTDFAVGFNNHGFDNRFVILQFGKWYGFLFIDAFY